MSRNWHNKRVTVMGLGRFGGGVGVTRWLAAQGARVTVTDLGTAEKLAESLEQLAGLDLTLRLGQHAEDDFRQTDLVVPSPAVPDNSPYLAAAREAGVPITTEMNLFVERCPGRCIGITGSVGKSTITAMIGHLLQNTLANRSVWVGGNIGRSLLTDLDHMTGDDLAVLELSSFQLQHTPAVRWSPSIAVITNITPNHLDRHGSFDAYVAAKLNIARFQDLERDAVVLEDTPELCQRFERALGRGRRLWRYGLDGNIATAAGPHQHARWPKLALDVPGQHNRRNAAAALTVAHLLGVTPEAATIALATFAALPHRLQRVGTRAGVTYYNDSKSTTPESAITAMNAIEAPLLVILGGYDKGSDLTPVAELTARRARFAACIGQTGPGLVRAITKAGGHAEDFDALSDAVAACQAAAQPGDAVLLSPACASWDQFADYRVRGKLFADLATRAAQP
ncbi:MAG: UDP-N-acetylmuramoyl-L-alanine--D-glutamate ligase [Planctomycetes bacterium]|nr:UDP-N-acetylmuramoyl-L-alanine--D-glutamate ligase [Planctomycetota bacterium]